MENRINESNEKRKDVKRTLRGIYVGESAEEVTIEASLEAYYKLLNCEYIDIVTRQIGGREYSIICDDEGTFKESPKLSAVYQDNSPALVGEIFITNRDAENLSDLNDDDVSNIMDHIKIGFDKLGRLITVVVLDK